MIEDKIRKPFTKKLIICKRLKKEGKMTRSLIDASTLVVTPIDMIDSNKFVTRKSSRKHVPNTQLINYDTS